MILNSDLILYHPLWEKADDFLCNKNGQSLFKRLIDLYVIACAIGIREDKVITNPEYPLESPRSIGRTVYMGAQNNNINDLLYSMLQNAIINSKTIDLNLDDRLKLAFDPDFNIPKLNASTFLNGFANYGLVEIFKHVDSETPLVAVDQMKKYLDSLIDPDYEALLNTITLDDILD